MEPESRAQPLSSTRHSKPIQLPLPQRYLAEPDRNEDSGLNLSQFLNTLRRQWLAIAGVFGAVTAATFVISSLSKPSYVAYIDVLPETSTGENQLMSSVSGTLENQSQGDSSSSTSSSSKDETMLNVLKSPKLLTPLIETLKQKYPDMKGKNADLEYAFFVKDLSVVKTQNTQIFHVEYSNVDPHKVKDAIGLLSKAYLDYSLQNRQKEVRQGLKFLEAQLPALEAQVNALEARLQGFRQQYSLVDPATQGQQISSRKSTFAEQRLNAQALLEQTKAIYADLQNQVASNKSELAAASPLAKNTRYQDALKKMQDIESELAQKSSVYRPDAPAIQDLNDYKRNFASVLAQERASVLRDVASQIRETQHQLDSIDQAEQTLNQQVKQYASLSRYYDGLQRKLKIATDNLNEFLSKREALQIEVAQKETPWQLLTPPTDPRVASKLMLKLLLGSTLGLLLGIGTAVLLEYWKSALYTVDDIRGITKVPVLEAIPFNKKLKGLISNRYGLLSTEVDPASEHRFPLINGKLATEMDRALFAEVFRSLYMNLRFLQPENPIRSLAVTSATAGAGSSTVAIYLAQAAAAMGQRVLLVDANLRSPTLQTLLGLDNALGLGTLMTTDLEWNCAIQHLALPAANPALEGAPLAVLTTGSGPQDATILLSAPKILALKQSWQAAFDLVIYDTASLADGVDGGLVATATDGLLMVASLGHTTHAALSHAFARLKHSPVAVLGIVANSPNPNRPFPAPRRSSPTGPV
jgi:polysaccharide biosynthesis transport protein